MKEGMKERNIWSSVPSTDYVDDVMRENPGMKIEEALPLAYDMVQEDRETICQELDGIEGHFVIYGTANTWEDSFSGFTPLFDTTLGEAFRELSAGLAKCDSNVWVSVNEAGDITACKTHHDGVNRYTLRALDREYDEDELLDIVSWPEGSGKWFDEHAKPCGHYIAERFGWKED